VLQTFVAANICSHLASTKEPPSTRGIPAPDCRRANSRDSSCEVPSVWCALLEGSRFLLFFAPLVLTCNAQPLRCFGPKHISAKGHPTGSSLLQKLRAGPAVEDPDNLIRYAPRASSRSVHTLAPNDKRAGVPKSKDPGHRWCEVQAGTNRRGEVADAGPLPTPTLTSSQRKVVNFAQNLS
jgi:hypothetical protein